MKRAEASAVIPTSQATLFAYVADPANLSSWQSGILSAEVTSPPPVRAGSTARVVRYVAGQRITAELRMAAYEPDRRLVLTSTVSGMAAEATLELTPAEDEAATTLSFAMTFTATNMFMRPVEAIAASAADEDLRLSLDRLRTMFADRA